ncbi:phosphoribosylformylglycinamidine synthase subunit PurL [Candidatus Marinamargulisbacteria bacterium SCGC AAA071-K20]|nr:phosphoribosylformylglycinamidine synthase subunit PurL [Candidatus Marinamargulisbacteria bacterium SCGC AAA071-K20]
MTMALSKEDEQSIEALLGRKPSEVETHIFDTMWSEHCSYKSTKPVLQTLPTNGSDVALGIGEDSGIVRFTKHNSKQYCIAISHESHNHPSQVLPVEGAATGVGGVVRDVYCMGADVVGVLDSLHFGIATDKDSAIVEEIAEKVVLGVSGYGNALGVPVLGGETLYHSSYNDNCLVNVAALGLLTEDEIVHSYVPENAKTEPYDVILFGKSTDATGFGGASFSSATLDHSNENIGAVQVHDPFLKRVLVEAIKVLLKEIKDAKVEVGFKDLGAGGISCATSEIAVGGGMGVNIDLDKVNTVMEGLNPEVIACSETQERFSIVVPRHFSETVLRIFNKDFEMPNLYPGAGAAVIGEIIPESQFIITSKGKVVCDLPVAAITKDVSVKRESRERDIQRVSSNKELEHTLPIQEIATKLLNHKNNISKHPIYSFYDNAVRGDTVLYPGEGDAVIVTPIKGCNTGLTISMDSNLYGEIDPFVSGAAAVAESVRNIICVGAKPIALTDCLNYGNPQKPDVFYDFKEGVRGISEAASALGFIEGEPIPIISGNVSLYNESKTGNAIIPSPVILCAGKIEDISTMLTMKLNSPNETLIMIGNRAPEFGGTQVAPFLKNPEKIAPQVRFHEEDKQNKLIHDLINSRKLTACHDISMGGLWMALVEMVCGERALPSVGLELTLSSDKNPITTLFSENGGYVISVSSEHLDSVLQSCKSANVTPQLLGKTTENQTVNISQSKTELISLSNTELVELWKSTPR